MIRRCLSQMQMEATSDAILKGQIWAETIDRLVGHIFKTNWDIYALCISIGIMHDQQIESDDMLQDGYIAEPRYVPHGVMGQPKNISLLGFMMQTALITTKHVNYDEDERLELAFNENKKLPFNPIYFFTKFANYGVKKISEVINGKDGVEMLEALMFFLNSTYEAGVDGIEDELFIDEFDE